MPEFPFYPMQFFPGFNVTERSPSDPMHMFGDGVTSYVGYWTFWTLIIKQKDFDIKEANRLPPISS